jgi:hypothetical protein
LVKEHLHLPQVFVNNTLVFVLVQLVWLYGVHLSLSIDAKYLVPQRAIKAFGREVQHNGVHYLGDGFVLRQPFSLLINLWDTYDLSLLDVPQEVVVRQRVVVEEGNKDFVHTYEATGDVWVWKDVNGHGIIINSEQLVEINRLLLDL